VVDIVELLEDDALASRVAESVEHVFHTLKDAREAPRAFLDDSRLVACELLTNCSRNDERDLALAYELLQNV
jgi:hypothetical protein